MRAKYYSGDYLFYGKIDFNAKPLVVIGGLCGGGRGPWYLVCSAHSDAVWQDRMAICPGRKSCLAKLDLFIKTIFI